MNLKNYITDRIQQSGGVIGFDEFMSLALYDHKESYYNQSNNIFGTEGDFITAPERSSLFATVLARQILQIKDTEPSLSILEIGAGSGVMARDILKYLKKYSALPEHYFIQEKSPSLKAQQQSLLKRSVPEFFDNIIWTGVESMSGFEGVVLANELFDALAFKRIIINNHQIKEMAVSSDGDNFNWQPIECDPAITQYINNNLPEYCLHYQNYKTEIHLSYEKMLSTISNKLNKGVLLVMDYGMPRKDYYAADKSDGTVRCFYKHTVNDNPFVHVGGQDITCDVEFTSLYNQAKAQFELLGYTTQANFLLGNQINLLYEEMLSECNKEEVVLATELKSLMMPGEMGERFKVIALGKDFKHALDGFSFKDIRHTL